MSVSQYEPVNDDAHPVPGVGVPDSEAGADHGDAPLQRPTGPKGPPADRAESTLGAYLRRQGFTVDDHPVSGRGTTWDRVRWIVVHHTVSACDPADEASEAAYLKTAQGRFPPLAQIMLGQSGTVWLLSRQRSGQNEPGRASHAGRGTYPGIPTDCANQVALGIEVQCQGNHPLASHPGQYAVLIRLITALCRRYGLGASRVIGHKEWSSEGKIDPRDSMATIRADVTRALGGQPAAHSGVVSAGGSGGAGSPFTPHYRQGRKVYRSKMRKGQTDSDSVWNLQNALIAKGYPIPGGPSDVYTASTLAACQHFQKAQGWSGGDADGIAGPQTVRRLGLIWVAD